MTVNLHVYPSPIVNESRIMRQTTSVASCAITDEVIICGTALDDLPRRERLDERRSIVRVGPRRPRRPRTVLVRALAAVAWSLTLIATFARRRLVIVNAHSVAVLPVCVVLSRLTGAKLIYDAHELETETIASRGVQQALFRSIETLLIGKCDAIFVVTESIGEWYRNTYPTVEPVTIRNVPDLRQASEEPTLRLREVLQVPDGVRLYVHAGNIAPGRNVRAMLEAFSSPRVADHLVFLGDGPLQGLVQARSTSNNRIHVLPPVPPRDLLAVLATADVGLCLTELDSLSQTCALPNKLTEYLLAGLPFFHTESQELNRLLSKESGSTLWSRTGSAGDLEEAVLSLTDADLTAAIAEFRTVSLPTWDEEAKKMLAVYRTLVRP